MKPTTATIDETHTKPSKDKQWQEKSTHPVISNKMSTKDIESHRRNLLDMYDADDKDITVQFMKIIDKNDEDFDDCLELIYKLKCVRFGKNEHREIFRIKIEIPTKLKEDAEKYRAQKEAEARAVRALPAPVANTSSEQTTQTDAVTSVPTTQAAKRPVVRKPAVRKAASPKK